MRSLLILDVLQMVCDSKEKKGEANQAPLKNFQLVKSNSIPSKFKSLNAHLSDFKKYLKTHQCSEWMLSEEFGIDISNTRIILGILILRGEVWKTVEQRCLTANKEAFFWTSNREIGEYFDQGRRLNHE